jgi:hypothetical protein
MEGGETISDCLERKDENDFNHTNRRIAALSVRSAL